MMTFALAPESYTLITGETGRTIHRTYGLTIGAEEWRALQRAVVTAGKSAPPSPPRNLPGPRFAKAEGPFRATGG